MENAKPRACISSLLTALARRRMFFAGIDVGFAPPRSIDLGRPLAWPEGLGPHVFTPAAARYQRAKPC